MELLQLQEHLSAEALAIKKCEVYAEHCSDSELHTLFAGAARAHRSHFDTLLQQLRNLSGKPVSRPIGSPVIYSPRDKPAVQSGAFVSAAHPGRQERAAARYFIGQYNSGGWMNAPAQLKGQGPGRAAPGLGGAAAAAGRAAGPLGSK